MDRDEVFGLRDYRKVWKQVILVVIYEFKFVTTQLCYVSFGTQKVQSGWGSAPDPDGSACSPMPPFVRLGVVGGGGGGEACLLPIHIKRCRRNERIVVTINASV